LLPGTAVAGFHVPATPRLKPDLLAAIYGTPEEAAEKHIFATSGLKIPYSFEGGYRSAGSTAPPKIGFFRSL
jgi:hypothetical protein